MTISVEGINREVILAMYNTFSKNVEIHGGSDAGTILL